MRKPFWLILCLLVLASGCSEESSPLALSDPAPTVATAEEQAPPSIRQPYVGPDDSRAVLAISEPEPEQLASWALEETAPLSVRVTSLRRLEDGEAGDAIDAAQALLADPQSDPQLKANAVAVLARSETPRAKALVARLEPRYQRLAEALRARAGGRTK